MELHVLYKIEVVAAPMVRSVPRYEAFSDGVLDWYFRLVGHHIWRQIQIPTYECNNSGNYGTLVQMFVAFSGFKFAAEANVLPVWNPL